MRSKAQTTAWDVRSLSYTLLLWGTVLALGVASRYYIHATRRTALKQIRVYGNHTMSHSRLEGLLQPFFNQPLDALNTSYLIQRLSSYPLVRAIKLKRAYPNELQIFLRERTPVAYYQAAQWYCLDEEGVILPLPDRGMIYNLPIIRQGLKPASPLKIGGRVRDKQVLELVDFLARMRNRFPTIYLDVSEISYEPEEGLKLISATNSTPVFLGDWASAFENLYVLEGFNQQIEKDNVIGKYKYIDLRFKDQVVVRERGR